VVSEIENDLQQSLSRLTPIPVQCLVREAQNELTPEEFSGLTSDQRGKFSKLTALSRRLEWSEARRCERQLREKLGAGIKTSISHSKVGDHPVVFAVGAALPEKNGIGVDAELASRAVSDSAARRFISPEEVILGIEPLELWVIKEALFKANPKNTGTIILHYRITSFDLSTRTGLAQFGGHEMKFICLRLSGWIVSVALF
jgi:hypothetical protein